MHFKEFLIVAFIAILLPIIDVPPYSLLIIGVYFLVCMLLVLKNKNAISSNFLLLVFFWLIFSIAGLLLSWLMAFFDTPREMEGFFNYLVRVLAIAIIFLSFIFVKEPANSKVTFSLWANYLFYFVVVSAIFEFTAKYFGLENVINLFKARENLGGIDTVHFNRFSGFWSFPGDAAAIIVISICLNYFSKVPQLKIKTAILLVLLAVTQSKAGIAFLLGFVVLMIFRKFSVRFFVTVLFSTSVAIYFFNHFQFEYLLRFINEFEWYLSSSKRMQEFNLYFSSSIWEQLLGLNNPFALYESEIIGSLSRVGFIGSFWFLSLFCLILYFSFKSKNYAELWLVMLTFLIVYCSISAGLSRYKISILFYMLFVTTLYYEIRHDNYTTVVKGSL